MRQCPKWNWNVLLHLGWLIPYEGLCQAKIKLLVDSRWFLPNCTVSCISSRLGTGVIKWCLQLYSDDLWKFLKSFQAIINVRVVAEEKLFRRHWQNIHSYFIYLFILYSKQVPKRGLTRSPTEVYRQGLLEDWFSSYVRGRQHSVHVGHERSQWRKSYENGLCVFKNTLSSEEFSSLWYYSMLMQNLILPIIDGSG